jgi:hypothetical protein
MGNRSRWQVTLDCRYYRPREEGANVVAVMSMQKLAQVLLPIAKQFELR